jgi:hypothetical protein
MIHNFKKTIRITEMNVEEFLREKRIQYHNLYGQEQISWKLYYINMRIWNKFYRNHPEYYTYEMPHDVKEEVMEGINEYYGSLLYCECGSITAMKNKNKHEKTKKHINYINSLNMEKN